MKDKDNPEANIFDFASKKGLKPKKPVSKEHSGQAVRPPRKPEKPISPPATPKTETSRPPSDKNEHSRKDPALPAAPKKKIQYMDPALYKLPDEPIPPPNKASLFKQNFEKKSYSDSEMTQMLEKINKMRRDLEKKLEDLHDQSGLTKEQLQAYLDNPQNVGTPQWQKIQQRREELSEKLYGMIGAEERIRAAKKNQEVEKNTKARKSKTLGNRKKWIPIR
ncbi:MAG: hypothetical protein CK425_06910 [Parachlamydia sp.]|nr:MAG: hypothetical protein CK425_06910 [Parachlamydia sp.]